MIGRAVDGDEGRAHAVRAPALAGVARHHTNLDIRLLSQPGNGTGDNLAPHRPELECRRSFQIGVLALLLAAEQASQQENKENHQITIRHAPYSAMRHPV